MTFIKQVAADLTYADELAHLDRQPGLSMSRLGQCRRQAKYLLDGTPPGEDGDKWSAMRGTFLHNGILAARKRRNRELHVPELDGQRCPSLHLAGLTVPGTPDEIDKEYVTDYKTEEPDRVRDHRNGGPELAHIFQVTGYAVAWGRKKGRVVYVPTTGTFDDWYVFEFEVDTYLPQLEAWLQQVKDTPVEDLPRDKWFDWCADYCPFFTQCRGERDELEEITDPTFVGATERYVAAREAAKDKAAAAAVIRGATGKVGDLVVRTREQKGKESPDLEQIAADYAAAGAQVPMRRGAPFETLDVRHTGSAS